MNLPEVDDREMKKIEQGAVKDFKVDEAELIANAGYQVADFVRKNFSPEEVLVYAGNGNNGGDALNAARRLSTWGFNVKIVLNGEMQGLPEKQLEALQKLSAEFSPQEPRPDVVIDGLVGYGLKGAPRNQLAELINELNGFEAETVSIDLPSGFDVSAATLRRPHVKPDHVLQLGMPKKGFKQIPGKQWLSEIGLPPAAVKEVKPSYENVFEESSIVRLE